MARTTRRPGESQPRTRRSRQAHAAPFKQSNLKAAGIDVGADCHGVAVPPDRAEQPVQRLGAFTADRYARAEWLPQGQIEPVGMESTGVSWMALCEVREERGLEVRLVDAHDARQVPGRKPDVQDCQWLQALHTSG